MIHVCYFHDPRWGPDQTHGQLHQRSFKGKAREPAVGGYFQRRWGECPADFLESETFQRHWFHVDLTSDLGQEDFSDVPYFSNKYVDPLVKLVGVSLSMICISISSAIEKPKGCGKRSCQPLLCPLNIPAFLFSFGLAPDGSANEFQLNSMIQPSKWIETSASLPELVIYIYM